VELMRAFRLGDREMAAFVGAGGKTTAMFRLAQELAARGKRIVTTTTTRIFAAQVDLAPFHIILDNPAALLSRLEQALADHPHVLVVGPLEEGVGKVFGLEANLVDEIMALERVDVVLVEADGARSLPFKAPASHEPVVPSRTTLLVPVAGIDVLGKPLAQEFVHRPELVARLAGCAQGEAITPAIVSTVIGHREGGLKGLPAVARAIPLINKVEGQASLVAARTIARLLLQNSPVQAVAIGAVREREPILEVHGRVGAVVLAAGASRRFGQPKQLLPWGDTTLVGHIVDQVIASAVDRIVVVVGYEGDQVASAVADRSVAVVTNSNWAAGQSASVQVGLQAFPPDVEAVLFVMADQPGLTPGIMEALLRRYHQTLAPIVVPLYGGQRGNPVLFDRKMFPELLRLEGDQGGRDLIERYRFEAEFVEVEPPGAALDIDTPENYENALSQSKSLFVTTGASVTT
jgi:molybdenum cofactor cytidylyltransferase